MRIRKHKINGKSLRTGGRSIRRRVVKAALYSKTFTRVRHYRGHGIHSPFVYALIREAFMKRTLRGADRLLYEALRNCGVNRYRATQLQNLHSYCDYGGFSILEGAVTELPQSTFCVIPPGMDTDKMSTLLAGLPAATGALAVLSPRQNRKRLSLCSALVKRCKCLSIDNRGYMLFFFDRKLPNQHFKL